MKIGLLGTKFCHLALGGPVIVPRRADAPY